MYGADSVGHDDGYSSYNHGDADGDAVGKHDVDTDTARYC